MHSLNKQRNWLAFTISKVKLAQYKFIDVLKCFKEQ